MTGAVLSGPGLGLPFPQNLYPSELNNAPQDSSSNRIALAAGEAFVLPRGDWFVSASYSVIQFLDPVTNTWAMGYAPGWWGAPTFISSDGFNVRLANLTGCPVSASILIAGNAYVQASTSISVTGGGGSTWVPIVGGAVSLAGATTIGIPNAGAGYGVPPLVFISPPAPAAVNANGVGGIQATGFATIASGTVSGFSFTNRGAGYSSPPTATVVPSPFDPNINTGITAASIAFSLIGSGSITGVLCTNPGNVLATNGGISLVVSGVGNTASIVANCMQSLLTASLNGAAVNISALSATTVGGGPNAGSIVNNELQLLAFRPRPAQITFSASSSGATGTVVDGGLFLGTPNVVLLGNGSGVGGTSVTLSALVATYGAVNDVVIVQAAP